MRCGWLPWLGQRVELPLVRGRRALGCDVRLPSVDCRDVEEQRGPLPVGVPNDHRLLEAAPRASERRRVGVQDEEDPLAVGHCLVEGGLPRVFGDVGSQLVLVVGVPRVIYIYMTRKFVCAYTCD